MSRRFRGLSMLLAVVLLAGLLVAFTPGDEREAKATLGPLQGVTLVAAAFDPLNDEADYQNFGSSLSSDGWQVAQVTFPAEVVVITSVKVRVFDNNPSGNLCVDLYRVHPAEVSEIDLGGDCTVGTSGDSPQTLQFPVFERVGRHHSAYLMAQFDEKAVTLNLYGATVFYRVVS